MVSAWISKLEQGKDECGFSKDELKWLSKVQAGRKVVEQSEAEYKEELKRLQKHKTEKTLLNSWNWKKIDNIFTTSGSASTYFDAVKSVLEITGVNTIFANNDVDNTIFIKV